MIICTLNCLGVGVAFSLVLLLGDGYRKVELDVWVPKLKLAFEYQGEQHYHNLESSFGYHNSLSVYTKRDEEKILQCEQIGVTLVSVPYWWDSTDASLIEIMQESGVSEEQSCDSLLRQVESVHYSK